MPTRKRHPCTRPGCNALTLDVRCKAHTVTRKTIRSAKAQTYHRLYDSNWRKSRRLFLRVNPVCEECRKTGHLSLANEIDHIIPHRGDIEKFWDTDNWQALCRPCHQDKTARGL